MFDYKDRTFLFARIFDNNNEDNSFRENLYSIEIRNGVVLPAVPFAEGTAMPRKYFTVNYEGQMNFGSYVANDYDVFQIYFKSVESVYVDVNSKIVSE
jgi:hypothetical protein